MKEDDFDEYIENNNEGLILVKFYAPWCGHCKKLAPEYERAAFHLSKEDPVIILADVDVTEEDDIKERYNVESYPTLKVFHKGKDLDSPSDYNGPRDWAGIVRYMRHLNSPIKKGSNPIIFQDEDDFEEFLDDCNYQEEICIVGFFPDSTRKTSKAFSRACNKFKTTFKFGEVRDPKVIDAIRGADYSHIDEFILQEGVSKPVDWVDDEDGEWEPPMIKNSLWDNRREAVINYRPSDWTWEDRSVTLKGHLLERTVLKGCGDFFSASSRLLLRVSDDMTDFYTEIADDSSFPQVSIFFPLGSTSNEKRNFLEALSPIAKQMEGKFTFFLFDSSSELLQEVFGVDSSDVDDSSFVIGLSSPKNSPNFKHVFRMILAEFDVSAIDRFLRDCLAGKTVHQYIKSEELTLEEKREGGRLDQHGILKVVGSTFQEDVIDNSKDVFLKFYAPYCSHCRDLQPEWEKLASQLPVGEDLVIAEIDATQNAFDPLFEVNGFPTIYLLKASEKRAPVAYNGERTADALFEWLETSRNAPQSAGLEVDAREFREQILSTEHPLSLINFYAPWCGYCKKLAPHFDLAATLISNSPEDFVLAKVNCDQENELCNQQGATSFPTLKIYAKGKETGLEYQGPRDSAYGIYKYMLGKALGSSPLWQLKSVEEVDQFIRPPPLPYPLHNQPAIVGYFSSRSSPGAKVYFQLAEILKFEFKFGAVVDPLLVENLRPNGEDIVIHRQPSFVWKEGEVTFLEFKKGRKKKGKVRDLGQANLARVKEFVYDSHVPMVGILDPDSSHIYNQIQRPWITLFLPLPTVQELTELLETLQQIAQEHPSLCFTVANKTPNTDFLESFDYGEDDVCGAGITRPDKTRFRMEPLPSFQLDPFLHFVNAFEEGSLERYAKSEELDSDKDGAVQIFTGRNFDHLMYENDKDIFLLFYTLSCGHCKELMPIWKKFALHYDYLDTLTIGKIDVTKNEWNVDWPEFNGYPAIFFAPSTLKESPIQYHGARTFKSLQGFLEKHASHPLRKPGKCEGDFCTDA